MSEKYYKAHVHIENIEKYDTLNNDTFKDAVKGVFLAYRNTYADLFNSKIEEINKAWDKVGEPASYGDYIEDINPNYVNIMVEKVQPLFDEMNEKLRLPILFYVNEYGDIGARLNIIKDVTMYMTLEEVNADLAEYTA